MLEIITAVCYSIALISGTVLIVGICYMVVKDMFYAG